MQQYIKSLFENFSLDSTRQELSKLLNKTFTISGALEIANTGIAFVRHVGEDIARRSLPVLSMALKNGNQYVAGVAALALYEIGSIAVPTLTGALKDKREQTRVGAALILGKLGATANDAIPSLISNLKDESPKVRKVAAWALGNVGDSRKEILSALSKLINDRDEKVSRAALRAFATLSENSFAVNVAPIKKKTAPVRRGLHKKRRKR